MTDKLFPLEKIRHKPRLHVFADLVTAMLSAIGGIIIAIPMVYILATAKHLPLNLAFLNLICALALTIGYSIAHKAKYYFDIRRTFTSPAIRASLGRSRKLKGAIENGIDVNESHIDGRTALMLAARNCKVKT